MRLTDTLPQTIATERLLLRAPRMSDAEALVTEANNWKVLEPTANLPFPYLPEHAEGFITRAAHKPGQRSYVIAGSGDDRLKGVIGFYFFEDRPVELGYWLGESHWGQGLAPEAVTGLVEAAEALGITPIRARVLAGNAASVRVLQKTGFVVIEETLSVVERHRGRPLLLMERRR
ncbi:GNAT family N-acetyltransferase [Devosia sp. 63-57]|uniref:GNAT family N-acetyltransferase n=1 Tax=Devosia sp. 63-57 TaxID=1895751 RepID=UPI0008696A4A|nr:GNAT family N-acetyltransferase [Devosia sp. 63-57]ODT51322.1 MAG: hypothetical protein ABS74_01230 [Pelagibacterium sp. SCN 63-126]ODU86612.1 MAG: hypothetical protein ABT14_08245 [Pelagibacterium sp. SCN 63-17]OJX41786.1 MAG: hypothetical protein BGO80_09370 [Devosia sp. 63-57]